MSELHGIKQLLEIKDKNIKITKFATKYINNQHCSVAYATLTKDIKRCPNCHQKNQGTIVKNGTKVSLIHLPKSSNHAKYLKLKKQRYHCRNCQTYFTANSPIIDRFCHISKNVHLQILESLTDRLSGKRVAKQVGVSWSTVQRTLSSLASMTKVKKNWLPECLLMDEIRSLKTQTDKVSISRIDGNTGKVFVILPSRIKDYFVHYFMLFELQARLSV
ncbi:MAG: transposase family protein [Enterococcus sp.]